DGDSRVRPRRWCATRPCSPKCHPATSRRFERASPLATAPSPAKSCSPRTEDFRGTGDTEVCRRYPENALYVAAVEEAFEDAAGAAGDASVVVAQLTRGGAEGDGEAFELFELGRERVARRGVHQEPPIPCGLGEPVRRRG